MSQGNSKKRIGLLLNILMYAVLLLCVLAVFLTLSARRATDGTAEIFGHQMRVVLTDSMAACEYTDVSDYDIKDIPAGSLILIETVPEDAAQAEEWFRSLRVGDVLTFRYVYATQMTVTHRITEITEKETGGFVIDLMGDNTTSESGQLHQVIDTSSVNSPNYVIGRVVGRSYLLGMIMTLLSSSLGVVLVIIVPTFIILLLEVIKIASIVSEEKKKKQTDEMAKAEQELAELRRKVAELESSRSEEE